MSRKTCLLIAALCLLIAVACVRQIIVNTGWQPGCVPLSILNAWTAGQNGHQVRIAVTRIEEGLDHSQAQALIGGKWVPLTERWTGHNLLVGASGLHFQGEPYRYLTLRAWMNEQLRFVELE